MPIFRWKTPIFPLKIGILRGVRKWWKNDLFLLFFNKNGDPYVIERPAVTASFSGGIGDLRLFGTDFKKLDKDE